MGQCFSLESKKRKNKYPLYSPFQISPQRYLNKQRRIYPRVKYYPPPPYELISPRPSKVGCYPSYGYYNHHYKGDIIKHPRKRNDHSSRSPPPSISRKHGRRKKSRRRESRVDSYESPSPKTSHHSYNIRSRSSTTTTSTSTSIDSDSSDSSTSTRRYTKRKQRRKQRNKRRGGKNELKRNFHQSRNNQYERNNRAIKMSNNCKYELKGNICQNPNGPDVFATVMIKDPRPIQTIKSDMKFGPLQNICNQHFCTIELFSKNSVNSNLVPLVIHAPSILALKSFIEDVDNNLHWNLGKQVFIKKI